MAGLSFTLLQRHLYTIHSDTIAHFDAKFHHQMAMHVELKFVDPKAHKVYVDKRF